MRVALVLMVCLTCAAPAFGQAPGRDDLQPGVNTSAQPPVPAAAPGGDGAAAKSPAKGAAAHPAQAAAGAKVAHPGKALDRLDLDTTQITGNKELPKVMYVVPWKHADLGDLTGKPANSLVDEVLQPVDRDVFNREERYYHTVAAEKGPSGVPPGATTGH
ncbi:MAG TPA: hypothetical protein VMC02_07745 [Steroidobacteraceae bacterium]|nr:hypothetical protein [Steroidobacteraceae bacterium]